ncbi:hypothetical protein AVEN_106180-1 [Araneus ventricosus]|uniref:Uncharacterized protein n=1 Tax=Araneus ventricosus TaxID=182803 RepID=A0A4Y2SZF0_ARAVE|nr:hypothetical protein AVEN_106180-1 [Araneus ventricosus]
MSVILTNSLRKPISCCVYVTGSTNLTTRVKSVCEKRLWGEIEIKKCVNCQFELQKWKVVPWRRKKAGGCGKSMKNPRKGKVDFIPTPADSSSDSTDPNLPERD